MYDSPPPHRSLNGWGGSPRPSHPDSHLNILLGLKEDIGAVKAGIRMGLENDRELFSLVHETRDRVTTLEAMPLCTLPASHPAPSTPVTAAQPTGIPVSPPPAAPGLLSGLLELLKALRELLPSLRELVLLLILLVAAIRGIAEPASLLASLGIGKPSGLASGASQASFSAPAP